MRIPILNGIYTDTNSDFRTSYPRNLVPVPKQTGISSGYLRPAEGIAQFGIGPGIDRGGINWRGICYRVMGNNLCTVADTGAVVIVGAIGGQGQVTLDYSFDRLAIASGGNLYYYDGGSVSQVVDTDLGTVIDIVWVDGYFMTTDGANLVVTELNDPYSVNPLKYGSSEADPDPIVGLIKLRNEVYALNRYTIEVFNNVGGEFFPFARIEGAQMQRGAIGTFAAAILMESIAFLGSGRNEANAVWIGTNSNTAKISTREIDQIISTYTDEQLSHVIMESRVLDGHEFLYIHFHDCTWVYDGAGSQVVQEPVWFQLTTSLVDKATYRARNFVYCYNKWLCGDPLSPQLGIMTDAISSHYGQINGWDFATALIYNETKGAVFHEIELISLTGNVALGIDSTIWTSYTLDGRTWSNEKPRTLGKQGERNMRINWLQQGQMRTWRAQKFRGNSDSHASFSALEVTLEPLYA